MRQQNKAQEKLVIYAADAIEPPLIELAKIYQDKTNVTCELRFTKAKSAINTMKQFKVGDVFIPATEKSMKLAEDEGIILSDTKKIVCYMSLAIAVQKGNPKKINDINDLANSEIIVGMGSPEKSAVGELSLKMLQDANLTPIISNIKVYGDCCTTTLNLVKNKKVDAVIGWEFYKSWAEEEIDVISIPEQYKKYYPTYAAVVKFTSNKTHALEFIDFLFSDAGKKIFSKYSYNIK